MYIYTPQQLWYCVWQKSSRWNYGTITPLTKKFAKFNNCPNALSYFVWEFLANSWILINSVMFSLPTFSYTVPIMLCCSALTIHLLCSRTKIVVRLYTVDGERFAGLNIRGFSAIKVFTEIFLRCLGHRQCISTHYLV